MDEHPSEHPQPGPPADENPPPAGGTQPPAAGNQPPAYEPAPWPRAPQGQPYPQAQPYPQPMSYPQAQPSPHTEPYSRPEPYPQSQFQPAYPQSGAYPGPGDGGAPLAAPPGPLAPPEPWVEPGDVRAAVLLAGFLVVIGILSGVLWSAISPHAQGIVVTKSEIIPLEQESWIAADGRFAIITAVIGLVVGAAAWFWRARRGPVLVAGLAIGAGLGALLTALVGSWLSSGHDTGAVNTQIRLRVDVHAHGLIALEAVLALAAYLVGVLFSGPDDLGRPGEPVEPAAEPGVPVGVTGQAG